MSQFSTVNGCPIEFKFLELIRSELRQTLKVIYNNRFLDVKSKNVPLEVVSQITLEVHLIQVAQIRVILD
jgi:hypothetical protein